MSEGWKNHNGWVPLSKRLLDFLPKSQPYSRIEAVYSLAVDYDNENRVTVAGYSELWGWSRKKVRIFLDKLGVEIVYPESTQKKQNQKGQIRGQIRDRSGEKKRQILFIDYKELQAKGNRSGEKKEQKRNRSGATTNDPIEPEPKNTAEIVSYLNKKTGKDFKPKAIKTRKLIRARTNEGYTTEDFKQVIDMKVSQWLKDPTMNGYLRPETLFGTKFESYLNEKPASLITATEEFEWRPEDD